MYPDYPEDIDGVINCMESVSKAFISARRVLRWRLDVGWEDIPGRAWQWEAGTHSTGTGQPGLAKPMSAGVQGAFGMWSTKIGLQVLMDRAVCEGPRLVVAWAKVQSWSQASIQKAGRMVRNGGSAKNDPDTPYSCWTLWLFVFFSITSVLNFNNKHSWSMCCVFDSILSSS